MGNFPNFTNYSGLRQKHIDWLNQQGVDIWAMIRPCPIRRVVGRVTLEPERFIEDSEGDDWLAFVNACDVIYWRPETGQLATGIGSAFALGEEAIFNAGTYSLEGTLEIWTDPVDWLRNHRNGIVILDWKDAYERLRHCPSITIPQSLVANWRTHWKPQHEPKVYVRPEGGTLHE